MKVGWGEEQQKERGGEERRKRERGWGGGPGCSDRGKGKGSALGQCWVGKPSLSSLGTTTCICLRCQGHCTGTRQPSGVFQNSWRQAKSIPPKFCLYKFRLQSTLRLTCFF